MKNKIINMYICIEHTHFIHIYLIHFKNYTDLTGKCGTGSILKANDFIKIVIN